MKSFGMKKGPVSPVGSTDPLDRGARLPGWFRASAPAYWICSAGVSGVSASAASAGTAAGVSDGC